jgi:release factor glutamine methyltransferase
MPLLAEKYSDNEHAKNIIWWILEALTEQSKLQLITSQPAISEEQYEHILTNIKKHVDDNYPLQYILKTVPFYNLTIHVEPPTLIPRPETEEWVTNLIEQLQPVKNEPLTMLDMCTGSGCIALALAQAFPHATVYAVDLAQTAIALAQKNATANHITNLHIIQSDLFTNLSNNIQFDLIVSNPPYISEAEFAELEPVVTQWEDKQALVADKNGYALIERIITNARNYLKEESILYKKSIPQLVLEIGYMQAEKVESLLTDQYFDTIRIIKDIYGKDRIVTSHRLKKI